MIKSSFSAFAGGPLRPFCSIRCLVALVVIGYSGSAYAGGGPENVFLVVNSADPDSLAIANHFAAVRKIPENAVFHIDWPDPPFQTVVDLFRQKVLGPTLNEIKRRRLTEQIDYIVYSSGFPYAINFVTDTGGKRIRDNTAPIGSITGMTYLHEMVMQKQYELYSEHRANAYARNLLNVQRSESYGFRARYGLDLLGQRSNQPAEGQHFYLSMMLGHTNGARNNTLDEVFRYLDRGVEADATNPKGTIYYIRNNNVRSTVRDPLFGLTAAELIKLGVNAENLFGETNERDVLPVRKPDVMGAMVGLYKIDWTLTNSKILPGAIIENFTSYGGVLSGQKNQTLLCHPLKYGAVASSGTVCEPRAFAAKFPHPRIHLHYARGCSVAESFYQSVLGPYQLLIVGDPLCQPWSEPPVVRLKGLDVSRPVAGELEFEAKTSSPKGNPIRNLEIYVDGQLLKRVLPGEPIRVDTRRLQNGYHELRVVAVEDTLIETQGRVVTGIVVFNGNDESMKLPSLTPPEEDLVPGLLAQVGVRCDGAREIRLYHGRRMLGRVTGGSGRIGFDPAKLGRGTVSIRAVAMPKNRNEKPAFGFPTDVVVKAAAGQ